MKNDTYQYFRLLLACHFNCGLKCMIMPVTRRTATTKIRIQQQLRYADLYNHDNHHRVLLIWKKNARKLMTFLMKIHDIFFIISPAHLKINLVWR